MFTVNQSNKGDRLWEVTLRISDLPIHNQRAADQQLTGTHGEYTYYVLAESAKHAATQVEELPLWDYCSGDEDMMDSIEATWKQDTTVKELDLYIQGWGHSPVTVKT